MKRILVISWFYPPINSSEGIVTSKLLRNSRYEYEVFTQNKSESWSYGKNMDLPDGGRIVVTASESGTLSDWKEEAFRYFAAHRDRYAAVMTRSMPPESHEVGVRIKKAFPEVKWIASLGDPIKNNPYQHLDCSLYSLYSLSNLVNRRRKREPGFILSPRRILYDAVWRLRHREAVRLRRRLNAIEDQTLALSDRLLFTNASQQRYMADAPPFREKSAVIRHSYDPSFYEGLAKTPGQSGGRQRFVFTGQLNAIRSPRPLLEAVRRLRDCTDDLAQRAEFVFFGDMPDADLAFILRHELDGLIRVRPPISYRQSLKELRAADWALHIDGNIGPVSDENVFFAGKIADYFGAGTPILAITMPEGDAADCLKRAGALVLGFSANEIKQNLYQILYRGLRAVPRADYIRRFDSRRAAEKLDGIVEGLLNE